MRLQQIVPVVLGLATSTIAVALKPRQVATQPAPDVTSTVTVSEVSYSTLTRETTVLTTIFSTIVITVTDIATSTVTRSDVDTATSIIYETSTQHRKRTLGPENAAVAASTTPIQIAGAAPAVTARPNFDYLRHELARRGQLQKRATVFTTVTLIVDGITTVFNTKTSTVISTTSSELHSTSTLLTTTYQNAKTTITITSTIVLTQTTVTAGPAQTVDSPPTGDYGNTPSQSGSPGKSGGSGGGGGLSTGAKGGIGAGAGAVGLLALVGIAFLLYKRHQAKPRVVDDGTGAGMSEVPVGPTLGGGAVRNTKTPESKPPAYGDRSSPAYKTDGPAELGGIAKAPDAELGGDSLPPQTLASEIDSRPVMAHHSGPVQDVYEMPAQNFR